MQSFMPNDIYVAKRQNDTLFFEEKDFVNRNLLSILQKIYQNYPGLKGVVFKKCVFNHILMQNVTFDKFLKFKECTFYGKVTFKECNFLTDMCFWKSVFHNKTTFDNCCYASYEFDFSEIQTRNTCDSFAIINTQHNQNFSKPAYTILNFKNAVFESVVAFNELKDLSFCFCDTTFANHFYFSNTLLGLKSIFKNIRYPEANTPERTIELQRCLQILLEALSKRAAFACEIEPVMQMIKNLGTSQNIPKETYTEQEMCDYIGIGRAAFQKMKTQVKQGKRQIQLPTPTKLKPLKYSHKEVEKFKEALLEGNKRY